MIIWDNKSYKYTNMSLHIIYEDKEDLYQESLTMIENILIKINDLKDTEQDRRDECKMYNQLFKLCDTDFIRSNLFAKNFKIVKELNNHLQELLNNNDMLCKYLQIRFQTNQEYFKL